MRENKFVFYSKYKSIRSKCHLGHYHPSKLEALHCMRLLSDKQNGYILDFKCHIKFELRVKDKLITNHYVDFLINNKDGSLVVNETKGKEMPDWIIKRRLFEVCYPEIPYIVIKK